MAIAMELTFGVVCTKLDIGINLLISSISTSSNIIVAVFVTRVILISEIPIPIQCL